jgi:hypothetical protein
MKSRIAIGFGAPIALFILVHFYIQPLNDDAFTTFYSEKLRSSLFSAFLTLGGFLYSLKTFILIKMKENVYDTDWYKARLDDLRKYNARLSHYGPLRRLSDLLFFTVMGALCSALAQFSIGFINHWVAAVLAIYVAICALGMFIISLFEIKRNLNDWFKYLEDASSSKTKGAATPTKDAS